MGTSKLRTNWRAETIHRVPEIMDASRVNCFRRNPSSRSGYKRAVYADTVTHLDKHGQSPSLPKLQLFVSSPPYRPYSTAWFAIVADFRFRFSCDTVGQFLHLNEIRIRDMG